MSEAERKQVRYAPLTDEQTRRLEELGFTWDLRPDVRWERSFELLRAYRERMGDNDVPTNYVTECGARLGRWVGMQRQRFAARSLSEAERKKKHLSPMTDEQVRRLEALGVNWSPGRGGDMRRKK